MQLMLDKGKELDWFHSTVIVALAVVAVVGFLFFLIWENYREAPGGGHPPVQGPQLRPPAWWPFRLRTRLFFGNLVILPLWLQTIVGYTATDAGHRHGAGRHLGDHPVADHRRASCPRSDARWVATARLHQRSASSA